MQDPDPKCRHLGNLWHFGIFCQKVGQEIRSNFSDFIRFLDFSRLPDFPIPQLQSRPPRPAVVYHDLQWCIPFASKTLNFGYFLATWPFRYFGYIQIFWIALRYMGKILANEASDHRSRFKISFFFLNLTRKAQGKPRSHVELRRLYLYRCWFDNRAPSPANFLHLLLCPKHRPAPFCPPTHCCWEGYVRF